MLLKRPAALKTHWKTRPKAYYPAIKEMFAILIVSLFSDSVTVFTSCKPKR